MGYNKRHGGDMKLLLIEDNEQISQGLSYFFQKNNYDIDIVSTYKEGSNSLTNDYDAIILDVSLPDGNGFDLYDKEIKAKNIPTIFLTAIDDEENIVKGLTLGAEDYVTKPFSSKELLARVNNILMRKRKNRILKAKDIVFDMDKMVVYKNDKEISLSGLERKILELLFLNINKGVTRDTLLDKIWELTGNDVDDHTITVYLKRIREKLGSDIIITIKGVGYRIDEE